MILRDTSIREQSSSSSNQDSQASLYFRGSSFNNNSGYNSSTFSSRERDCSSPFLSNSGPNNLSAYNNQLLSLGSRENNAIIMRDSAPIYSVSRVASNRFLSGGLDQRIIKQSTEDCRRLLQQVSCTNAHDCACNDTSPPLPPPVQAIAVVDTTRVQPSSEPQANLHQQAGQFQPEAPPKPMQRVLTSSNSFDAKSNAPNFAPFNMSAEAARLFQTLQQSPLPLPQNDVINYC